MKTLMLVGTAIAGIALTGATVFAGQGETRVQDKTSRAVPTRVVRRVILVETTASRIPQRVVINGKQANTASPLSIVQGPEGILNTGAVTVPGLLSLDPDVSVRAPGRP